MFSKVIVSKQELKSINERLMISNGFFGVPIFSNKKAHPRQNPVAVLFLFSDQEEYILPFNHNDVRVEYVEADLSGSMMAVDAKDLYYRFPKVTLLNTLKTSSIELIENNKINSFLLRHDSVKNPINTVPLFVLGAWAKTALSALMKENNTPDHFTETFDTIINPSFHYLESQGIKIDTREFLKKYPEMQSCVDDGFIYSRYNPYTRTGRASNSFNGFNFLSLNKTDGTRKCFISRFGEDGCLVELDYEAFQPRLITAKMGTTPPTEDFHTLLAKQYFPGQKITPTLYQKAKEITFAHLYDVTSNTTGEFFTRVAEFSKQLYEEAEQAKYVSSTRGRKIYLSSIDSPTPSKLLSYLIQAEEVEVIMSSMYKCITDFEQIQSKPILYNYDSILFDVHKEELERVKSILVHFANKQFPFRLKMGRNFHELNNLAKFNPFKGVYSE